MNIIFATLGLSRVRKKRMKFRRTWWAFIRECNDVRDFWIRSIKMLVK